MSYFKSFIIDNKSNVGSWLYVKWSSGVKVADDQRQYLIKSSTPASFHVAPPRPFKGVEFPDHLKNQDLDILSTMKPFQK